MKRLGILWAGLLLAGLLVVFACAPGATPAPATPAPAPAAPAASPEWQRVVGAAGREGRVTIYNGSGANLGQAIREWFPKHTGIVAEEISLDPASIREKVRMEQQTGAYTADVGIAAITMPADISAWGLAQTVTVELPSLKDKAVFRVDPWQYDPEKKVFTWLQESVPHVLINTNMVKEGEITSWHDLLDPRWKGKMIAVDPRFRGVALMQAYSVSEMGLDFWKKMAQQNIRFDRRGDRVVQAIALGERPVGLFTPTGFGEEAILAGAPIKYLHLKEGSSLIPYGACIVANAPHPNAALVFLNWLVSKEGNEAVARGMQRAGIRKDLDPTWIRIPEYYPDAAKKVFTKVATTSKQGDEAIAFMRQALGEP